jgi:general stress protein YciG
MANHRGGAGNFAEDRERASEAGRKGGQHSGGTLKTILNALPKRARKGAKTVMVAAKASAPDCC